MLSGTAPIRFQVRHLGIFRKYLPFRVSCSEILYSFRQFQPVKEGMAIRVCRVTANTLNLEQAAIHYLVKQPYGNLIYGGKCFFFRNMAFFVQLRKIFPVPFPRQVKSIIHKAVTLVPGKSKEYAGLSFSFCPGDRNTSTPSQRNASLFSQNTYHLQTAYQKPAQPVWKAVPGKCVKGADSQKGRGKWTAAWCPRDMTDWDVKIIQNFFHYASLHQ